MSCLHSFCDNAFIYYIRIGPFQSFLYFSNEVEHHKAPFRKNFHM